MMLRIHQSLLVLLALAVEECSSFSLISAPARRTHLGAKSGKNVDASIDLEAPKSASSDLRALLPKPSSRPLKLDKFGRRVYRMEDDNTIKLTKGEGAAESPNSSKRGSTSSSPELSTLFESSKEIASLESSANFRSISTSSDLKALLPQREMKWRTLDKYGRRVQKMEDEGPNSIKEVTRSESDVTTDGGRSRDGTSSPLSELLQSTKEISGYEEAERSFREFNGGGDLKSLLPSRKMTWMKLDKFGRRVERMEDDGTVNKRVGHGREEDDDEESSANEAVEIEGMIPDFDETNEEEDANENEEEPEMDANAQFLTELLKVGDSEPEPTPKSSRNLKELLPTKTTVWTKLDFKGGSVEDERRTKTAQVAKSPSDSSLKTLLLQSKKPTFTKLDFKGVGVEDPNRTKKTAKENFNQGQYEYSSLKTLLPERKIQWGSRGRVVSISDSNVDVDSAPSKSVSLKTLLPERKVTWRGEGVDSTKS